MKKDKQLHRQKMRKMHTYLGVFPTFFLSYKKLMIHLQQIKTQLKTFFTNNIIV